MQKTDQNQFYYDLSRLECTHSFSLCIPNQHIPVIIMHGIVCFYFARAKNSASTTDNSKLVKRTPCLLSIDGLSQINQANCSLFTRSADQNFLQKYSLYSHSFTNFALSTLSPLPLASYVDCSSLHTKHYEQSANFSHSNVSCKEQGPAICHICCIHNSICM